MILLSYKCKTYNTTQHSIVKLKKGVLIQVIPAFSSTMLDRVAEWHKIKIDTMPRINVNRKADLLVN